MLGLQYLDMLNMRGRSSKIEGENERDEVWRAKSDVETDFGTIEEAEGECGGSGQKNESEASEQGEGRAKKQNAGSGAKKGRVDLKIKAKTKTWSVVVKGLEEDESTQPIQSRRVFQTSPITWKADG